MPGNLDSKWPLLTYKFSFDLRHILTSFIYVMSSKELIYTDISVVDHTPAIVYTSTDLLYLSLINVNNTIITPYNSIMSQFVLITFKPCAITYLR